MNTTSTKPSFIKIILWAIISLVILALAIAAVIYFWPTKKSEFQSANIIRQDYTASMSSIEKQIQDEQKDSSLRQECRSFSRTHGQKTAKAVLLIHGVSGCTGDMSDIAEVFYNQGYNVYAPRVAKHGDIGNKLHSTITFDDMANFMSTSASQVSGLGDEIGVIGHSGGGNMATWLAQHSDGLFSRVLLIAPFYEPSAKQAPKWQIPFLRTLYGNNILPDRFSEYGLSYRALAKYVIIKENYKSDLNAPGLKHVGVVVADGDHDIDQTLAHNIPKKLADNNNTTWRYEAFPESTGITHDMIRRAASGVAENQEMVFDTYLKVYENRN